MNTTKPQITNESTIRQMLKAEAEATTQKALAETLGISEQYLSDMLLDRRSINDKAATHLGYKRELAFYTLHDLAEAEAKLSERATVHQWLTEAGIPAEEGGAPICLLRRLRIAINGLAQGTTAVITAGRVRP